MRTRSALILATWVSCIGCKALDEGAKEHFARAYSCPDARIEVQPRPELKWSDLLLGPSSDDSAPTEVKQDPERLAKWREDHQQSRAGLDEIAVFEVSGCDHHVMLGCSHPRDSRDGAELVGQVACSEAPAPATP